MTNPAPPIEQRNLRGSEPTSPLLPTERVLWATSVNILSEKNSAYIGGVIYGIVGISGVVACIVLIGLLKEGSIARLLGYVFLPVSFLMIFISFMSLLTYYRQQKSQQRVIVTNLRVFTESTPWHEPHSTTIWNYSHNLLRSPPLSDDARKLLYDPPPNTPAAFFNGEQILAGKLTDVEGFQNVLREAREHMAESEAALRAATAPLLSRTGTDAMSIDPALVTAIEGRQILHADSVRLPKWGRRILWGFSILSILISILFCVSVHFGTPKDQRRPLLPLELVLLLGSPFASLLMAWTVFTSLGWPGEKLYMVKDALISFTPPTLCFSAAAKRFPITKSWFPLLVYNQPEEVVTVITPGTDTHLRGELLNFEAHIPLLIAIALITPDRSDDPTNATV